MPSSRLSERNVVRLASVILVYALGPVPLAWAQAPQSPAADEAAAAQSSEPLPSSEAAAATATATPAGKDEPRERVLVLPVVVGEGTDPDPALIAAVVKGLRQNPNWDVISPASGDPVEVRPLPTVPPELLGEAEAALAATQSAGAGSDHVAVVAALEPVMQKLLAAVSEAPLGASGIVVVEKIAGALLAAHAGAGQEDAALATASTLKQLLPGLVKPQGFSVVASALFQAAPTGGVSVRLTSKPKGCDILLNGQNQGASPVTVQLRPQTKYAAVASCKNGAQPGESFVRTISVEDPKTVVASGRQAEPAEFTLDATLASKLQHNAKATRLQLPESREGCCGERPQIPVLAERFGATRVVAISAGQFQGTDWVNARSYSSAGAKGRHGLARTDSSRATALGAYLSTGRRSVGVLDADDPSNLAVASETIKAPKPYAEPLSPWYADVAAWSMLGSGAVAIAIGLLVNDAANDKRTEAELNTRNDPIRRNQLNSEANTLKFWGGVGMYGGLAVAGGGLLLLLLPEFEENSSEIYAITPLPGGGTFSYGGRF